MRIHYLQHVPFEGLGAIKEWVHQKGFFLTSTRLFDEESLPNVNCIDWLIIMGGPMSAYDEDKYPWIEREKEYIYRAILAGKRVLGICLGAQLIANVLGAAVTRASHKEIGWHPIELTEAGKTHPLFKGIEPRQLVFHWHGDTFSIPDRAISIAQSSATPNQGFVYQDRVVALQFHMEMTVKIVHSLVDRFAHELVSTQWVQSAQQMLSDCSLFSCSCQSMYQLLENLAAVEG